MRKRIILLSLVIINTFALVGCGQSKAEIKKQVKAEVRQELKSKNGELTDKDMKGVSVDEFNSYSTLYTQYNDLLNQASLVCLPSNQTNYTPPDKARELLTQAKGMESEILKLTPKFLLTDFNQYKDLEYALIEDTIANPPNGKNSDSQKELIKKIGSCKFPNKYYHLQLYIESKSTK